MSRRRGVVVWFSAKKGYGFIQHEGGAEVFVHHSAIQAQGYRTLQQGQQVEFDLVEGSLGRPQADMVTELCIAARRILLVEPDTQSAAHRVRMLTHLAVCVFAVIGYREICTMPSRPAFEMVAITVSCGRDEVRKAAAYVRACWPSARILLLGETAVDLDDALYDDIVNPAFNPSGLVEAVARLSYPA